MSNQQPSCLRGNSAVAAGLAAALVLTLFVDPARGQAPGSLEEILMLAEMPRSTELLVDMCTSADSDRLAYCRGYVDGAMHYWRKQAACASELEQAQSYCAGAMAAEEGLMQALDECPDCDESAGAFRVCSPDEVHDEHYCSGYNAELSLALALHSVMDPYRGLGLYDVDSDLFMHVFASEEFHAVQPCLAAATRAEDVMQMLLEFLDENPAHRLGTTAIMSLARASYRGSCPDVRSSVRAHLEHCTPVRYEADQYVVENACDEMVVVQFMARGEPVTEMTLAAGEVFETGVSRSSYIFTACPVDHVSSVRVAPENWLAISGSRYNCIPK